MEVLAIKSPVVQKGDDVFRIFLDLVSSLSEGSIVCVASKIVAYEQGRVKSLEDFDLQNLVREEADEVLSEGEWALAVKDRITTCNAGIDNSNVEEGSVVLWPEKTWEWAQNFREKLSEKFGVKELGIVITDSRCSPRRLGVTGFALAWAGFEGIQDERGKEDLFGNKISVTQRNVADSVADSAILVMGETNESSPFAIVREAPVSFTNDPVDSESVKISREEDLFRL